MIKGHYYILDNLQTHLEADPLVNAVTQGDLFEVDIIKQTIFPLYHVMINSQSFVGKVTRFSVSIIGMGIVDKSKEEVTDRFRGNDDEQDVLNTQFAILQRLFVSLRNGDLFDLQIQASSDATLEPFTERYENYLAGYTMTLDVDVPNTMTIC